MSGSELANVLTPMRVLVQARVRSHARPAGVGLRMFLNRRRDGDIMRNRCADEDGSTSGQRKCSKGAASATGPHAKATTRRHGGIIAESSALAWEPIRTAAASVR